MYFMVVENVWAKAGNCRLTKAALPPNPTLEPSGMLTPRIGEKITGIFGEEVDSTKSLFNLFPQSFRFPTSP
jgi:hypothetical protein